MSKQKKNDRPRRVDYWHDPAAPKPTSRKPSASVVIRNSAGDLLLVMVWDPPNQTLIAANVVGQMPWTAQDGSS